VKHYTGYILVNHGSEHVEYCKLQIMCMQLTFYTNIESTYWSQFDSRIHEI